jgi:hypothetical protein
MFGNEARYQALVNLQVQSAFLTARINQIGPIHRALSDLSVARDGWLAERIDIS